MQLVRPSDKAVHVHTTYNVSPVQVATNTIANIRLRQMGAKYVQIKFDYTKQIPKNGRIAI